MGKDRIPSADPAGAAGRWSVNADASLQSVLERPDTPTLLRQTLVGAVSWQSRSETSVRGVLRAPRMAPRWVGALLAMGATVGMGEGAEPPEVPLEALLQRQVRGDVYTLRVPCEGVRWGEAWVGRTPADTPIVAAVAVVAMDGDVVGQARVALAGAWPEAVRLAQAPALLVGGPLDAAGIRQVVAAIEKEVAPRGDFLGSEEYRRAMAGVLTRRALEMCLHWEVGSE